MCTVSMSYCKPICFSCDLYTFAKVSNIQKQISAKVSFTWWWKEGIILYKFTILWQMQKFIAAIINRFTVFDLHIYCYRIIGLNYVTISLVLKRGRLKKFKVDFFSSYQQSAKWALKSQISCTKISLSKNTFCNNFVLQLNSSPNHP